jgi:hypothetical protein
MGVLLPVVCILATHENKTNRSRVIHRRSCNRPSHAAAQAFGIGEAVPIHVARLQSPNQHPARPIGCRGNGSGGRATTRVNISSSEISTFSGASSHRISHGSAVGRPQQNTVAIGVSRCNSLREKIAALVPCHAGHPPKRTAPGRSRTHGRHSQKRAPADHRDRGPPPTTNMQIKGYIINLSGGGLLPAESPVLQADGNYHRHRFAEKATETKDLLASFCNFALSTLQSAVCFLRTRDLRLENWYGSNVRDSRDGVALNATGCLMLLVRPLANHEMK